MGKVVARLGSVEVRLEKVEARLGRIEEKQNRFEERQGRLEQTMIRIENDHGKKLRILFDGYSQLYDISMEIRKNISELSISKEKYDLHILSGLIPT